MESTLHRQLKTLYANHGAQYEVPVDRYRVDVVCSGILVEIQPGPLAAIRRKVEQLLSGHRVLVVKPLVRRKVIVRRSGGQHSEPKRRRSPKKGRLIDLFDELVHFTQVFPHERLTLDVPVIDIEEWRVAARGGRRRRIPYQVEDRKLVDVLHVYRLRHGGDLQVLLPRALPERFDTAELATLLDVPRWRAQRVAYCLRRAGLAQQIGKRGNSRVYRSCTPPLAGDIELGPSRRLAIPLPRITQQESQQAVPARKRPARAA